MEQQLIQAIESRDLERVRELLAAGANPNARKGDRTALQLVPHRADEIKWALIEAGAEDAELVHSLVAAIGPGRAKIVYKILIERGADVNVLTHSGTPIQVAARQGYTEIADLLIAAGADVDASSKHFHTLIGCDRAPSLRDCAQAHRRREPIPTAPAPTPVLLPWLWQQLRDRSAVAQALIAAGAELDVVVPSLTLNRFEIQQQAAAQLQSAFQAMEAVGTVLDSLEEGEEEEAASLSEATAMLDSLKQEKTTHQSASIEQDTALDSTPNDSGCAWRSCRGTGRALLEAGADPHRKDGEGLSAY